MLSFKTIKYITLQNLGYYIFIIPYRIAIITHTKQNQRLKINAQIKFGNFWHEKFHKILIINQIVLHFLIAALTLIYKV